MGFAEEEKGRNLQESLLARVVGPRLQVPFFLHERDIKRRHHFPHLHHHHSNHIIYITTIFSNTNDKLQPVVDLHAGLLVVRQVVPADHHQHALTSNLMTMTMTMTRRPFTSAAARAVNVLGIAIFPRQICRQIFFIICWGKFCKREFFVMPHLPFQVILCTVGIIAVLHLDFNHLIFLFKETKYSPLAQVVPGLCDRLPPPGGHQLSCQHII